MPRRVRGADATAFPTGAPRHRRFFRSASVGEVRSHVCPRGCIRASSASAMDAAGCASLAEAGRRALSEARHRSRERLSFAGGQIQSRPAARAGRTRPRKRGGRTAAVVEGAPQHRRWAGSISAICQVSAICSRYFRLRHRHSTTRILRNSLEMCPMANGPASARTRGHRMSLQRFPRKHRSTAENT